jgi:sugar phosphate isomerase/epimerase
MLIAALNAIGFTTANYVARETGWAMDGWLHGDRVTHARFCELETYAERLDEILKRIRELGFRTVDVWSAHLSPDWATEEHVAAARESLERHGLQVAALAVRLTPANVERVCELATGLGTQVVGAAFSGEPEALVPALRKHGVRLAVENHPERTPQEVLAKIERGDGVFAATVDTGWWGTQGYDPADAIEQLRDHLAHVHLKDVRAVGEPHDTCPWGEGIVDVEACVRTLRRIGYDGALVIEHEPEDHDPSEEIRELRERLEGWLA